MLKKIHLWIGIIGLIVFALSGQYFLIYLGGLKEMADVPRLLLRTSHIYLFLASALNLALGLYYLQPEKLRWYHFYTQGLLMISPFLILYGFIFETLGNEGIDRPVGNLGLFAILFWMGNLLIGWSYQRIGEIRRKKSQR